MTATAPWQPAAGGLTLAVRLTPKGGRDAIDGIETLADGRSVLKARVRAAPSEGEANDALCRLIAKAAGVAPRDVDTGCRRHRAHKAAGDRGRWSSADRRAEKNIERR
ncbi:MAG: DUF167 family protein [Pseudolabrys sp.]